MAKTVADWWLSRRQQGFGELNRTSMTYTTS
jgi:hypothetical protein